MNRFKRGSSQLGALIRWGNRGGKYRVFHAIVAITNRFISASRNDIQNLQKVLESYLSPIFCCKISLLCPKYFGFHINLKMTIIFLSSLDLHKAFIDNTTSSPCHF